MGEIKITDIVDQRLQHAAAYLDKKENGGNNNGIIDGGEVSVFGSLDLNEKGYVGEAYSAEAKAEHAKIMKELGLELKTAPQTEETGEVKSNTEEDTIVATKAANENLGMLQDLAKNGNSTAKELLAVVKEDIEKMNTKEYNDAAKKAFDEGDKEKLLELARKGNRDAYELCVESRIEGYSAIAESREKQRAKAKQTATLNPVTRNLPKSQKAEVTARKDLASSKDEPKGERNWVKDKVKVAAKKTESIDDFKTFIKALAQRESIVTKRNAIWNDALIALDLIPEVKTKKDVENIEKTMEETLKAQGRWNNVTREVAKKAKEVAKKQLINEVYVNLVDQFKAKMEADKAKGVNYNFKQYLKDIKNGLGDTKDNYKKEAFEELERYAKATAEELNNDATAAAYYKKPAVLVDTSYKKTGENKHAEKIFEGKAIEDKRAVELQSVTREEIEKALGDKLVRKLEVYMEENKNPDGTYNLSKLVTDVDFGMQKFHGADAIVNHHSDKELDERTNCSRGIQVLIQEGISDKEFKKIREFAKIKDQGKSRNFGKAVKKALPVLAEATAAGILFGVRVDQKVQVTIKTDMGEKLINDMISQLGAAAESITTGADGTVKILVHQVADLRLIQGLMVGLGASLLDVARNMIFGMEEDEKACFNNFAAQSFKSIDKLEKWLAVAAPDKKDKLIGIAKMYVAAMDGDEEKGLNQLYDDLNTDAGPGSVLNKDECLVAKYNMGNRAEKLQNNKEVKPQKDEVKQEDDGTKWSSCTKVKVEQISHAAKYGWVNLGRMYDCFDDLESHQVFRAMQIIQALEPEDGKYDSGLIREIVKNAYKRTVDKKGNVYYVRDKENYPDSKLQQEYPTLNIEKLNKIMGTNYAGNRPEDDPENKAIAPLHLYDNGEIACTRKDPEKDRTKYKKAKNPKGYTNNPKERDVCEYTISDKSGTRKVTKEEYQKSKYKERQ